MTITYLLIISITQAPVAVVTAVNGDVQVSDHSGEFSKASILMTLNSGDSLVTNRGNTTILYNNGKIRAFTPGTRVIIDDLNADTTRGGENPDETIKTGQNKLFSLGIGAEKIVRKVSLRAPYDSAEICICTPGNTSLIDARPSFVWRPCPEANWYELRLKMKTETVVKVITVDTSTIYPENKDDLLPGTYVAKILAFHDADTLAHGECIFILLDEEQINEINSLTGEIEKQDADALTISLLKAVAFQSYKMNQEAINNYQKVLALSPDEPVVLKAVAKLYSDIGDIDNANKYFSELEVLTDQ